MTAGPRKRRRHRRRGWVPAGVKGEAIMIVTKKAISRRTVLRGLGTAVSLPLLDAMIPALTAAQNTPAKAVRRLAVVYHPNGVVYENWLPGGAGTDFTFSRVLAPLEPF